MEPMTVIATRVSGYGGNRYGFTTYETIYRIENGKFVIYTRELSTAFSDSLFQWSDDEREYWGSIMDIEETRKVIKGDESKGNWTIHVTI
jgi:hypothetical protein